MGYHHTNTCFHHDKVLIIFFGELQIWIFIELLFVYFFYVETRGPTLEELAKIFDGDSATVAHVDLLEAERETKNPSREQEC